MMARSRGEEKGAFHSLRGLLCVAIAVMFGCGLSLIVGEIVVRVFGLAPSVTQVQIDHPHGTFISSDNPTLVYVPKPSTRDINSYGIRDVEHSIEKSPGVYRILVIGDSIAFGFCNNKEAIPIPATFPKVLEGRLNARFSPRRFEVINLAVSGYDTVQEVEFLKAKGLALNPDLVLVSYCLNDGWTASLELVSFKGKGALFLPRSVSSSIIPAVFHASHLVRFVWQRAQVVFARPAKALLVQEAGSSEDRPSAGFRELKQLSDQHHFSTMVAVFPLLEKFSSYPHQRMHDDVKRKAEANGFSYVDLLEPYWRGSGDDPNAVQGRCIGAHPDERGHAIAAEAIERAIVEQILGSHG